MIDQLFNAGGIQSLEKTVQFAARRHELLAHNIANFSTPNFRAKDVSVNDFRAALGQAIDQRRRRFGGERGELEFAGTREVVSGPRGLRLNPAQSSGNILFHDRNDRDLERTMQSLVENLAVFRFATDMMRSRMEMLNVAIRERI